MGDDMVLVIDGNSLVHRSFHALAGSTASEQQPAWAVRGLLGQLVAAVDRIRATRVIVGFDDPHSSLRRERWPQYKANRAEKLPTLVEQLLAAVETMRALGLAVVVPQGLEADDVLASVAAQARASQSRAVIVTSDRDAFSLIDDTTSVLRIINGGVDASPLLTPERLVTLLGVRPEQYRDYAALRGDASDNLPGVNGIGPKTAARLLATFGTAAAAFDDLDVVQQALGVGVARRLAEDGARAAWELNHLVMAQHCDVPIQDEGGALPLPVGPVAEVFRAHNLTWSAAQATRVLCDAEIEVSRPPRQEPAWNPDHARTYRSTPRRETVAKVAATVSPQLALF
ncbi:MAG TPA: 5'-3' exonuclease H3TH domain-containing protein [Jatrophihabitans sp.]